MRKSLSELSVDSITVYERLTKLAEGETVLYSELSAITGRDIQKFRTPLVTAQKMALRENNMVFVTIPKTGIKRLSNTEIPVIVGANSISRIRNISRKGAKKIVATDYDLLPNEAKIRHNAVLSVLGAFMQMTKQKSMASIEKHIEANDLAKLTYSKTLDQFKAA